MKNILRVGDETFAFIRRCFCSYLNGRLAQLVEYHSDETEVLGLSPMLAMQHND